MLHGCTSAIHLDPMVMIDLDLFEAQYAPVIAEYFNEATQDNNIRGGTLHRQRAKVSDSEGDEALQCGICFDRIRSKYMKQNRRFALLEKCDHCFCGPCILEYRAANMSNAQVTCPLCRIPSKRFCLSDRFYKCDNVEKKRLFETYKCQCSD